LKNRLLLILFSISLSIYFNSSFAQESNDSRELPYKISPESDYPGTSKPSSNIDLKDPKNLSSELEYDEANNEYVLKKKAGSFEYGAPYTMSFDEYKNYDVDTKIKGYWRERYRSETFEHQSSIIPSINIGNKAFETIFGGSTIDIQAQGSATIRFGVKMSKVDNPNQPEDLRRNTTFDFKNEIRMNVVGKVGTNLEMQVSYDTESQFDFDNTMKIRYQGNEDDIIQKIEAGDVSLPLTTSLISGSQSLFGILTELKFGNLYVTTVFSQQEGETKTINVEGGAQKTDYSFPAVMYDKNRHFFLSHYFRKNYDAALANLPAVYSDIVISDVEVWVTNTTKKTDDARNILAVMDLGEENSSYVLYNEDVYATNNRNSLSFSNQAYPDNNANNVYADLSAQAVATGRDVSEVSEFMASMGYANGKDFEKIEVARRLEKNEYYIHEKLGYISLNSALNADEVLAVSFKYSSSNGIKQVGELTTDVDSGLIVVKLLKPSNFNPQLASWNLMMKNIYSIGAFQVNQEDFIFEVEYFDDETGAKIFNLPDKLNVLNPEFTKRKLLKIMNLDNLNSKLDRVDDGDGAFDFVDEAVIRSSNGRIMFPTVEPFGGYLKQQIIENTKPGISSVDIVNRFVFNELYDSTQYKAEQITAKNKFTLSGSFKSSGGSEIFLNAFNVPKGSVKVSAGGILLQENIDYTVDYNMGRVRITNESFLASGTPIKITLESNNMFSVQSKTLIGTHLDYRFSPDFNVGATILSLKERPLTQKVNMGEEPISNTIWGLNTSYRTDAPFLTRLIDRIPLIETKEMSSITLEGEFAQLIPGHNDAIGETGNAFIDDFEGSESSIDLRSRTGWVLASTPLQFREASLFDTLTYGYNRAKLAWYQIDPIFFRSGSPVSSDDQSSLLVYRAREQDIFPNKETQDGIPTEISTFDLAFYPNERGPYNYELSGSGVSAGLDANGNLKNPETRWGGVMRELSSNDFEATNVEHIRFWMMDPFVEENVDNDGGYLYFNLGNVSEDILRDGRKSYENGLPSTSIVDSKKYKETKWGRIPSYQTGNQFFENDEDIRRYQDVGLDGLSSSIIGASGVADEQAFFAGYIDSIRQIVTNPQTLAQYEQDPSNDNYMYFRDAAHDAAQANILARYKKYNNHEGNSPVNSGNVSFSSSAQTTPDVEDINGDFTLSENESYFQYRVRLSKNDMVVGRNYITDVRTTTIKMKNGTTKTVKWYQFKVPIDDYETKYGNIQDFKSIRFMRTYLTGWNSSVVLRFARLELVRGEWRTYDYTIKEKTESNGDDDQYDPSKVPFSITTVNIEENANRAPVNYVLPPGVSRQQDPSNPQLTQMNEQSLSIRVDSLDDGYSKAIYKNINMDMRDYGKLQMYIHAEKRDEYSELNDNDISCFVRLGSDFTDNYYEYEIPLKVTDPWVGRPYDWGSDAERAIVWPTANNLIIDFAELTGVKEERNRARRELNSTVSLLTPFKHYTSDGKKIVVKGNPSLANVKTIMIGIKNPLARYNNIPDDGRTKSGEIWVNELRLTDFKEDGGWAATGRMTARLADFGTVTVAGSTMQPGFGSIEQKASERSKEETNQIDVAANLEMGKFFPEKAKVRIPMHLGYSRTAINPEYNPLDQDILLENTLNDPTMTEQEKKDLLNKAQDLTERKSINFTNVGIGKIGEGKTRFYSPSNVSVSYAYSEMMHRDVNTAYDVNRNHNGGINYVYNNQAKAIEPFKQNKLLRKPALRLIGDFNFYYAPSQVSLSTTMDKRYSETLLRNLDNPSLIYTPSYDKRFDWNRKSSVKYNLSKSIKLDFSTNTNATIEELDGVIDRSDEQLWEAYKREVWNSIKDFGTPDTYNQQFNASWAVPINKVPGFKWVTLNARYAATYQWDRARGIQNENDTLFVGHTIKNSQNITLNGQVSLDKLYNSIKYIDELDKKYKKPRQQRLKPRIEDKETEKAISKIKADTKKRVAHNLNTLDILKVTVIDQNGAEVPVQYEVVNENKIEITVKQELDNAKVKVQGKVEIQDTPLQIAIEHGVLFATGLKDISITSTNTKGSILGGYKKTHQFGSLPLNPGLPFIFGLQDDEFAAKKGAHGELIDKRSLITPFAWTDNLNLMLKAKYEPVRNLRIDFGAMRNTTGKHSEYYYKSGNDFVPENYQYSGSYTVSIWMLSSAMKYPGKKNYSSAEVQKYKSSLIDVAWRLADERKAASNSATIENGEAKYELVKNYNPGTDRSKMPGGYSTVNPDVAIPAFLAAYTNQDAKSMNLNYLKNWAILRPDWKVKYDGLKEYEFIKKFCKNLVISHGYKSTFTVGSVQSNIDYNYNEAESGDFGYISWNTNSIDTTVFISQYNVSNFSVNEKFLPLLGVDLTLKNNTLWKVEFKKSRNITVNLLNSQMLEVYTREWVIGSGYRFDKVRLKINKKAMESDFNLRGDFSIRNNLTVNRNLIEDHEEISAGQKAYALNITGDYQISDKLNFRAYYKWNLNDPFISSSYKTADTQFGFEFRFSLAQ